MKTFKWNSPEWWEWLAICKRRPSAARILRQIKSHQSITTFHGCRPLSVVSYYANGLKLTNIAELNAEAKAIFSSAGNQLITECVISSAISSIDRVDEAKLFVVLDDRDLVSNAGHYLIYGSEHICGIGASLTRELGFDCQRILKKRGTPTVFHIELPIEFIPKDQIAELAEIVNKEIWRDYRHIKKPLNFDFSFMFRKPIPGSYIVGHEHPLEIPDPLFQNVPYNYKTE